MYVVRGEVPRDSAGGGYRSGHDAHRQLQDCFGGLSLAAPAQATNIGNEGCTPGYWKNHPTSWEEVNPTALLTFDHVSVAFPPFAPSNSDLDGNGTADTFMDALNFKGGTGLIGAERILFRAAVAAWLNAAKRGGGLPIASGRLRSGGQRLDSQWGPADDA